MNDNTIQEYDNKQTTLIEPITEENSTYATISSKEAGSEHTIKTDENEKFADETKKTEKTMDQDSCKVDLTIKKPYHERYYLLYNNAKVSTNLDLKSTSKFLQDIGYNGGELQQARYGQDIAENFRNVHDQDINQMYCSYCGSDISGVEYYRLPDKRLRCTSCSNTLVNTKAEVEEIYNRILLNLATFFGADINVPISIEILDERKLKRKVGLSLGEYDNQSVLILGVAVHKNKKYSILLENGAPRISLIATFAHELTHIWQYTNWGNKKGFEKFSKDKHRLIYEGMAKWSEIQYLYLVGEKNVARREEEFTRKRDDVYGIGFCMYENCYPLNRETMTCDETPFTTDKYPID